MEKAIIFSLIFLSFFFIGSQSALATDFYNCRNIDGSGTWVLQNDINGQNCINIIVDDVILDLNNKTITSTGTTTSTIDATNRSNVTVKNGYIYTTSYTEYTISFFNLSTGLIENIDMTLGSTYGLHGILLVDSENIIIEDTDVHNDTFTHNYALYISNTNNTIIRDSNFTGADIYDISITNTCYNTLGCGLNFDTISDLGVNSSITKSDCTQISCFDINESGYYELEGDIIANKTPCININVSDVILNLNNKRITPCSTEFGTCKSWTYGEGILVQPPIAEHLTNITIENGLIDGFGNYNIIFAWVNNSKIENVVFAQSDVDLWITEVKNSEFNKLNLYSGLIGIKINGAENIILNNSYLKTLNYGILANSLYNSKFDYLNSYFELINTTITPTCWDIGYVQTCILPVLTNETYYVILGSGIGAFVEHSFNNTFQRNLYANSLQDFILSGDSYSNRFLANIFYAQPNVYKGLVLTSATYNNYGCQNIGYIINQGTNNVFTTETCEEFIEGIETPCIAGYTCDVYNNDRMYVDVFCNVVNRTNCPIRCRNGLCVTDADIEPIEGLGYYAFILSPIFLSTIVLLGFAGFIEHLLKAEGKAFMLSFFAISLILSVLGIYPWWLGFVFLVVSGVLIIKFVFGAF